MEVEPRMNVARDQETCPIALMGIIDAKPHPQHVWLPRCSQCRTGTRGRLALGGFDVAFRRVSRSAFASCVVLILVFVVAAQRVRAAPEAELGFPGGLHSLGAYSDETLRELMPAGRSNRQSVAVIACIPDRVTWKIMARDSLESRVRARPDLQLIPRDETVKAMSSLAVDCTDLTGGAGAARLRRDIALQLNADALLIIELKEWTSSFDIEYLVCHRETSSSYEYKPREQFVTCAYARDGEPAGCWWGVVLTCDIVTASNELTRPGGDHYAGTATEAAPQDRSTARHKSGSDSPDRRPHIDARRYSFDPMLTMSSEYGGSLGLQARIAHIPASAWLSAGPATAYREGRIAIRANLALRLLSLVKIGPHGNEYDIEVGPYYMWPTGEHNPKFNKGKAWVGNREAGARLTVQRVFYHNNRMLLGFFLSCHAASDDWKAIYSLGMSIPITRNFYHRD